MAFNQIQNAHSSYAALFFCIAVGFVYLRLIFPKERALLFWVASALANALGFLLWSARIPLPPFWYYLFGELFHVAGFFLLVFGALSFIAFPLSRRVVWLFVSAWFVVWLAALGLLNSMPGFAGLLLKLLRALVFGFGGVVLLLQQKAPVVFGRKVAGWSLYVWSGYVLLSAVFRFDSFIFFGVLIGLHVLVFFGLLAMLFDRIKAKTAALEQKVSSLEGILPICSYCKKIRDETSSWRRLEEYIEDRSRAEFSHGICPDCFAKHRPDRD